MPSSLIDQYNRSHYELNMLRFIIPNLPEELSYVFSANHRQEMGPS